MDLSDVFLYTRHMKRAFLVLLLLSITGSAGAADGDFDPKLLTADRLIVLLGSFKNFEEAHQQARVISRASGMPFSMQGMVYDKKRGLILPDDDPDTMYAGSYFLRRHNTMPFGKDKAESEYISIERSEAYPGLRPGYYIIVGGIYDETSEAKKAVARFKPGLADAEIRKTQIYMGCMH